MSLEVTVRFTGELRSLADQGSMQISLEEGATLRDAIMAAGKLASPAFAEQALGPFLEGKPGVPLLLLNRRLCSGPELDRVVGEGDVVAFVLPMEGG
jgi:molybdopterin converting factor small subunit